MTITEKLPVIAVMIVDDHFVVRSGLVTSLELEDDLRVVAEVDRGEDTVEAYRRTDPTVVLMDLQLPGMGGTSAISALRAHDPRARVLVFSAFARDDEIQAALDAGALGYLQKSASRDELLTALRHVARGARSLPPEVGRRLAALRLGPAITPREREILALIAAGRANKEIAGELGVSEDTVKRHVSHILEKLDVSDRAQATAVAIRRGIIGTSG
jgi:DNA-binding NarL/FixJ family response regulator